MPSSLLTQARFRLPNPASNLAPIPGHHRHRQARHEEDMRPLFVVTAVVMLDLGQGNCTGFLYSLSLSPQSRDKFSLLSLRSACTLQEGNVKVLNNQ